MESTGKQNTVFEMTHILFTHRKIHLLVGMNAEEKVATV